MLNVHNDAVGTVSTGYDAAATSIVLTTGHGARFPTSGPFRARWWNKTDYPNSSDDPNREIVEVATRSTDTMSGLIRGLETGFGGLAASTKNTSGKVYGFELVMTARSTSGYRPIPDSEVIFFDDFHYRANQLHNTDFWQGMIDSNHAMFNWQRDDTIPSGLAARHSGFAKIVSDTASSRSGFFQLIASFGTWGAFITGGRMELETVLFMPAEAVSNATNNYTVRIGLGLTNDSFNNTENGIWFEYNHAVNSGNWRVVTRQAGVVTNIDSSVAVTAGVEAKLRWARNTAANSVEAFINGTSIGSVSTNVFADAISCGLFMHIDRAAGTARRCLWVDWMRFSQLFDAR